MSIDTRILQYIQKRAKTQRKEKGIDEKRLQLECSEATGVSFAKMVYLFHSMYKRGVSGILLTLHSGEEQEPCRTISIELDPEEMEAVAGLVHECIRQSEEADKEEQGNRG